MEPGQGGGVGGGEPVEDANGEGDVGEDGPGVGSVVIYLGLLVSVALEEHRLHDVDAEVADDEECDGVPSGHPLHGFGVI